jgi:CRP-like cAMP-binding protein
VDGAEAAAAATLERALALRRLPGLEALDPALLTTLAARTQLERLAAGERLEGVGAPPRSIRLVLEGTICQRSADGRERRLGAGSLLAPSLGAGSALDAVAAAESLTLAVDLDDLAELCDEHFPILLAAVRALARAALGARRGRLPPDAPAPEAFRCAGGAFGLGERIAFLASCPTLADVPVHTLGQLAQDARSLSLDPAQRLWRAGDPAGSLVAIVEGRLDARAEGSRFSIGPGGLAGLLESVAGEPHWYDAQAGTPLVALAIEIAAVLDAAEDDPETATDLLAALARSLALSPREEAR